jgi:hypothetical protein
MYYGPKPNGDNCAEEILASVFEITSRARHLLSSFKSKQEAGRTEIERSVLLGIMNQFSLSWPYMGLVSLPHLLMG